MAESSDSEKSSDTTPRAEFKSRPARIEDADKLKESIQSIKAQRELDKQMPNLKPTPKENIKPEDIEKIINKLGGRPPATSPTPTEAVKREPEAAFSPVPKVAEAVATKPVDATANPIKPEAVSPERDAQRTSQIERFKNIMNETQKDKEPVKSSTPEEIRARINTRKYGVPGKGTEVPIPSKTPLVKPEWPKESSQPNVATPPNPQAQPRKGLISRFLSKLTGK